MRVTKAEEYAIAHARQAAKGATDPDTALLMACRAFRDAMPPRQETASDRLPDFVAGGHAARQVLDAGSKGILVQSIEDILVMAGRALVEKAVPSPKVRKSKGLPDYEGIGRAADQVYNRKTTKGRKPNDDDLHMAMGKAGIQAAWRKR